MPQATERTNRVKPLFKEPDAVCLEDRAGLLFEIGKFGIVLQQRLRLGTHGVAPIGNTLKEVQQDRAPIAILGVLCLQIGVGGIAGGTIRFVLFIVLREIPQVARDEMGSRVNTLIEIRQIAGDDEFLSPQIGPRLPQSQRDREVDSQRPIGELARTR